MIKLGGVSFSRPKVNQAKGSGALPRFLIVKYQNEAEKDLKLSRGARSILKVPTEQIWSGAVKTNAVLFKHSAGPIA